MHLSSFNRWKAFGVHLALSALIAATVVMLVVVLWYPQPYFLAMGGENLLRLLIGVDVVLGPLITLIIFDPAKPRLKYDLAAIAVLQLAALAYGSYVMFEARPVYNVFVGDRFKTVAGERDRCGLARAARTDEFRVAAAVRSARGRRKAAAGSARSSRTSSWDSATAAPTFRTFRTCTCPTRRPRARSRRRRVRSCRLAQRDKENSAAIDQFVGEHGRDRSLGYVPVKARNKDFSAVVDRKTGEIVGYLAINPW